MRTQLLLCLSITSAFAQQNAARFPPAEWNHPITLDVAVTEKSGKAITGLQQQDFTLLDKKQQQKILSFQAVTGPAAADPPVKAILLIDEVNTGFDHVAYTRQQVTKFLKQSGGQLAVPVSLALFSDAGVKMFGAPTRDAAALQAQLDDNQNGLRTIRRSQGIYGADERLDLSIRAIAQLAEQLGQEPGRKLILWVGPGWPYLSGPNIDLDSKTQARFFNSIVDFSAVLRHNRITLYSIDPLGTDDGVLRPTFYEEYLKGVTSSTAGSDRRHVPAGAGRAKRRSRPALEQRYRRPDCQVHRRREHLLHPDLRRDPRRRSERVSSARSEDRQTWNHRSHAHRVLRPARTRSRSEVIRLYTPCRTS